MHHWLQKKEISRKTIPTATEGIDEKKDYMVYGVEFLVPRTNSKKKKNGNLVPQNKIFKFTFFVIILVNSHDWGILNAYGKVKAKIFAFVVINFKKNNRVSCREEVTSSSR